MSFTDDLHLHPTIEAVVAKGFVQVATPIATIKAVHSGPNAAEASSEDAGGLESIICPTCEACVMLIANLWVDMGLLNSALGTVVAICYENGETPPHFAVAVIDSYRGPTQAVPITPLVFICWFMLTFPD